MSQRFIFKHDEVLERVSKGRAETRLLARADRVEIIKQYVPQGSTFYLDSAEEWQGFEFIYLLEGRLKYLGSEPHTVLEPGDYIARQEIEERSWFRAESDATLLYMSSQPAFNIMQAEIQEFLQLAEKVERDEYTDGHCRRLEKMARLIGERLELSALQLYNLSYAAFYHDVGKAKVPIEILQKPSPLTTEEWEQVRKHTIWGREMLETKDFLKEVAHIVGQTHERVDGKGYPLGLKRDEISIEARIIAVVDTYDAITTDRPYRNALTKEEAIQELKKNAGTQLDERVVHALIEIIRKRDPFPEERRAWFDQERARLQQREAFLRISEGILAGKEIQQTLNEVVNAITQHTPFRRAALALYDRPISPRSAEKVQIIHIACAGLTPTDEERIKAHPLPPKERKKVFREDFRISRSYYVPHDRLPWGEHPGLIKSKVQPSPKSSWHPDDTLCIPMWIEDRLLGTITVDEPVDGRVPTTQTLEPMEMFANLTAIAVSEAENKRRLHEAVNQLKEASYRDPLTKMYNRRYLDELIKKEQARARRSGFPISLLLIDFNKFRAVNERYGHLEGDRVLRESAAWIEKNVPRTSTVIRYGGDEFLVVMPKASQEQAEQVSEILKSAIAQRDFGVHGRISIRTGISSWDPHVSKGFEEVFKEADSWLYQRKAPKTTRRKAKLSASP
ncbi:MAG: hypothetical protein A2Z21_03200 [Candidatus Fraserbacteria bacterium RBG_16_55_9]|uniref:Diguanylate cyclase n=1 Tax=Fraserbacteria sp. (strain RBG_16_55_9) TaxID=1817864 RepID=A0A1F5V169_FRAXR|nr:MAG: hypothetical protein A2Z21_03200 [Candidatus Fraserbacteria bacterium RBG_16_55_9]